MDSSSSHEFLNHDAEMCGGGGGKKKTRWNCMSLKQLTTSD